MRLAGCSLSDELQVTVYKHGVQHTRKFTLHVNEMA